MTFQPTLAERISRTIDNLDGVIDWPDSTYEINTLEIQEIREILIDVQAEIARLNELKRKQAMNQCELVDEASNYMREIQVLKAEIARLTKPQYDEKHIKGTYFNYCDEYATGSYIERNIQAEFKDRVLSWKKVLQLLDSTEKPLEDGEKEFIELLDRYFWCIVRDGGDGHMQEKIEKNRNILINSFRALHDKCVRLEDRNKILDNAYLRLLENMNLKSKEQP